MLSYLPLLYLYSEQNLIRLLVFAQRTSISDHDPPHVVPRGERKSVSAVRLPPLSCAIAIASTDLRVDLALCSFVAVGSLADCIAVARGQLRPSFKPISLRHSHGSVASPFLSVCSSAASVVLQTDLTWEPSQDTFPHLDDKCRVY
ncbi:hypothetical protein PRIPAC_80431 [Pristionchus pacificus]|uniref:Uncharacterized protein n=1 Tax=Pristionchus pacificus TaxID=54126 RepID=A0A2A6CKD2_PRIPA|nr:hypothetical protein PRIPAC_80431 [Pristionchus pacificus]|eukprot:PDM78537.1 hypothetical protein PRIPAC_31116 [Pristionchus pacificus]